VLLVDHNSAEMLININCIRNAIYVKYLVNFNSDSVFRERLWRMALFRYAGGHAEEFVM
jgi:hypothetical protein